MILHAPWGGREIITGARVMDVFAGTGAVGLEALSRGAAHALFVEQDRAALAALRANIAACRAEARCTVLAADALTLGSGQTCGFVFLDPPYGRGLVMLAIARLRAGAWIGPDTLVVAETGQGEPALDVVPLAERTHGAARLTIWRG
jgi:16S rRNA (guanine966-N2)-methyltransferase